MLQEETIEKNSTGYWGRTDCEDRSDLALEKFPVFFNDSGHVSKTEQVLGIVEDFFRIKKGVYINHRIGTPKSGPFTAIKVDNPVFPNAMKQSEKNKLLKRISFFMIPLPISVSRLYITRAPTAIFFTLGKILVDTGTQKLYKCYIKSEQKGSRNGLRYLSQ